METSVGRPIGKESLEDRPVVLRTWHEPGHENLPIGLKIEALDVGIEFDLSSSQDRRRSRIPTLAKTQIKMRRQKHPRLQSLENERRRPRRFQPYRVAAIRC